MPNTAKKIKIDDEFRICPTCDYRDGFHSMLEKEEDKWRTFFICPSCHDVFDIGMSIPLDFIIPPK